MPDDAPRPDAATPNPLLARPGIATAVHEIERHVATGGWDGPVRVFALVRTAAALEADPSLADRLPPEAVAVAREDVTHLLSVEQEGLPQVPSLEELLGQLSWPPTVDGMAIVVERVVLPSAAEEGMPDDPEEALAYLMAHPDRQDVRIAVGVLRDGQSWCAIRARANDDDDAVAGGAVLVPGLVEAVAATLA